MSPLKHFEDGSCDFKPWRPADILRSKSPIKTRESIDISKVNAEDLVLPGEEFQSWKVSRWQKAANINVAEYLKQWTHWDCFQDKVLYDVYLPLSVKRAIVKRVSSKFDPKRDPIRYVPDKYLVNYMLALAQADIDISGAMEIFNHIETTLASDDYVYITYVFGISYLTKMPQNRDRGLFWMIKSAGAANGENVSDYGMDMSSLALRNRRSSLRGIR